MKKFIYIIVSIMVLQLFVNSFGSFYAQTAPTTIILESKKEASKEELIISKKVLNERLKAAGLKNFEIEAKEQSSQLHVKLDEAISQEALYTLLTTRGLLTFMETYTLDEVLALVENKLLKERLLSLVNKPANTSNVIISQASIEEIQEINELIGEIYSSNTLREKLKFSWSKTADDNGQYALFALKKAEKNEMSLGNAAIKEVSTVMTDWGQLTIMITFNQPGATDWATFTKEHINQAIAIVIDDVVYSAPIVREAITGGKAMIIGDFEQKEVMILSAILQCGALPLDLNVAAN